MKQITIPEEDFNLLHKEIRRLEDINRELLKALAIINKTSKSAIIEAVNNKNIFEQKQDQQDQQEQQEEEKEAQ